MTAPTRRRTRAFRPLLTAFVRFVVCGGGVGLASSAAVVLLGERIPMAIANALVTVVSTVLATELHRRISFRSERRGWGVHLQSGVTVAVSYAFTTGALLCLFAVRSDPSPLVAQAVYLSASALAGIGRFALLRVVVFGDRTRVAAHEDTLNKSTVAMAV
ncbi:GtrA family protein [Streptomyces sp. NPDC051658]|uniref:GtrA family protein n=1 Tax=Streptomyces sp. NPDC051658 TaxID=3365667 RepID=UPI00378C3929